MATRKLRTMTGLVVGRAGQKTVRVRLTRKFRHPVFEKVIRRAQDIVVHDESGEVGVGERVLLRLSRPLSRSKRWAILPTRQARSPNQRRHG